MCGGWPPSASLSRPKLTDWGLPNVPQTVFLRMALLLGSVTIAMIDVTIPKYTTMLVVPSKS
jgi:hypothetical protein